MSATAHRSPSTSTKKAEQCVNAGLKKLKKHSAILSPQVAHDLYKSVQGIHDRHVNGVKRSLFSRRSRSDDDGQKYEEEASEFKQRVEIAVRSAKIEKGIERSKRRIEGGESSSSRYSLDSGRVTAYYGGPYALMVAPAYVPAQGPVAYRSPQGAYAQGGYPQGVYPQIPAHAPGSSSGMAAYQAPSNPYVQQRSMLPPPPDYGPCRSYNYVVPESATDPDLELEESTASATYTTHDLPNAAHPYPRH